MTPVLFGARIAQLRDEAGYTQQRLAIIVGVSQATMSDWERGVTFPTWRNLNKLSRGLGVAIGELFDVDNQ